MRWLLLWFALVTAAGVLPGVAESPVVQEFTGTGSTTTGFFKVQDRWEIRWNARRAVSVAVMSSDGTIVAGAAGVLRGSLFLPLGGQYYLKIRDVGDTDTGGADTGSQAGAAPAIAATTPAPGAAVMSWHLQIVQVGTTVASSEAMTVYTPYFLPPDAAVTPAAGPPPDPKLTDAQSRAVVVVKGDTGQEIGFVLKTPEGYAVVTHLRLLEANPNVHVYTVAGAPVPTAALKGATDRDLAELTIQNARPPALMAPVDFAGTVQLGDRVLIPSLGPNSEIMLGKPVKLSGIAPDRLDFDDRLGDSQNGAPAIQEKSGNVLALTTATRNLDLTNGLARAWPANPAPGSASVIPYYGLRLDNVRGWQVYDPGQFLAETLFLKQFHQDTRSLDSYLNGRKRLAHGPADQGPPDNKFYLNNAQIKTADDHYKQMAGGGDRDERYESGRELLFTLNNIADTDVDRLQAMNSPYAYDQDRAREEAAYRQALKKELDNFGNNPALLDSVMETRDAQEAPSGP